MNDFKKLNKLVNENRAKLNSLYKDLDNDIIKQAIEILNLQGTKSERIAILRRIVDLKIDPLKNEFTKLGKSEEEQKIAIEKMYDFTRKIHEKMHFELLIKIKKEKILNEFFTEVITLMHRVGIKINKWQELWQSHIIDGINKDFDKKFKNLKQASEFCEKNKLFQTDDNQKADRTYGAIIKTGEKYQFFPYATVFKDEVLDVANEIEFGLINLEKLCKNENEKSYINYFKSIKNAFLENDNDKVIKAWQEAEICWMNVRDKIQPAHPLEYYEDAYTHAVALEWDIRLVDEDGIDEESFKSNIQKSFEHISKEINLQDENIKNQVISNIQRTQLYVSVPLVYYGAELNGLFSAQVVPNDEKVSKMCGKKIFAFVNYIYESAKAKPFMRLSSEIFEKDFLNFGREILYTKPEIWKKVYEISTIGHEFGHILFIDNDTELLMNKNGVFKFIEEYKATTGGLVNFFLNKDEKYKMAVFHELIARAIGLIAWMEVDEVRAYYCEGLIHLSLLFQSGVLSFKNKKLSIDFSELSYKNFKEICLNNYKNLAKHYADKKEASEFLNIFCEEHKNTFLPKDVNTKEFVLYFYERYKDIGNDVDESGEWEKWQNIIK
ncbi:invasion antigen B [Campylobacter pinnipediorum subsp. caledonicus]|uniref:invasion protein CiaB n=1 Tax=Campylobacter pinnipediorum TaxID=1965231 RepID=UPI0009955329|nr:invasion protein CiaB [Campylobacter pinnipediorum]AQW86446.1 invasion antigen B [Campylobacter pinnipediorum subsp. caledonicus]